LFKGERVKERQERGRKKDRENGRTRCFEYPG
jgi:hypothetical protein